MQVLAFVIFIISIFLQPGASQACDKLDADVLVLGGGIAGATVANSLNEKGVSFVLLEAGDKLGGRIRNFEISPGVVLNEGAAYIQGIDVNVNNRTLHPLIELANKCGGPEGVVIDYFSAEFLRVYNSSGYDVTGLFENSATDYYNSLVAARNYSKVRWAGDLPDQSCRQGLNVGNWIVRTPLDNFTEWGEFDWNIADSPDSTSLYGNIELPTFADFHTSRAGDYYITDSRGLLHLVDCLVKPFTSDNNRIKLNSVVTKINNMDDCVCVTTTNGNYCGKYAVITFSAGVLKSREFQQNILSPPFSSKKLQALNVLEMAQYVQIFVEFDRRFWDSDVQYVGYVSEMRGYYPVFATLKDLNYPVNVVIFAAAGDMAVKVLNQDKNITQEEIMGVLRNIYNNSIPSPQNIYIENFMTNPLFLGATSKTLVGVTRDTYPDLSSPEGRLYFAGEAYSENYSGFVHGAYLSALETAANVTKIISSDGYFFTPSKIVIMNAFLIFFFTISQLLN